MPSILITNNQLHQLGGSELVTLEIAEAFLMHDWDVTLYSNLYTGGLVDEILKLPNINHLNIIKDPNASVGTNFDFIWVHHNLIPPSIINTLANDGLYAHIIWHHMSPWVHMELPIFSSIENKIADIVTSISDEIDDVIIKNGIEHNKIMRFDNPAPDNFSSFRKTINKEIRSILIVSNHLPDEVKEAASILENNNIHVQHYGKGGIITRITPEILIKYDAVITIGKTVQYSLSVGVPVYEYDHFGGCGWIIERNYHEESRYNFSGRATKIKKSANEIASEIMNDYSKSADFIQDNVQLFADKYNLSNQLSMLIDRLPSEPTRKHIPPHLAMNFLNFMELHRGLYRELTYYKSIR